MGGGPNPKGDHQTLNFFGGESGGDPVPGSAGGGKCGRGPPPWDPNGAEAAGGDAGAGTPAAGKTAEGGGGNRGKEKGKWGSPFLNRGKKTPPQKIDRGKTNRFGDKVRLLGDTQRLPRFWGER